MSASGFTYTEIQDYRTTFDKFDKNADAFMDKEELRELLGSNLSPIHGDILLGDFFDSLYRLADADGEPLPPDPLPYPPSLRKPLPTPDPPSPMHAPTHPPTPAASARPPASTDLISPRLRRRGAPIPRVSDPDGAFSKAYR
jgi:hypothetical protein